MQRVATATKRPTTNITTTGSDWEYDWAGISTTAVEGDEEAPITTTGSTTTGSHDQWEYDHWYDWDYDEETPIDWDYDDPRPIDLSSLE